MAPREDHFISVWKTVGGKMNLILITLILSASLATAAASEYEDDSSGSYNVSGGNTSRKGKVLSLFQIVSFPVSAICEAPE